jgi:hypothetical protein
MVMADADEVDRLCRRLESFKSTCNIALAMAKYVTDQGSFTEIKQTLDSLKSQVAALQQSNGSPQNPLLLLYLDETMSYVESIVDPLMFQTMSMMQPRLQPVIQRRSQSMSRSRRWKPLDRLLENQRCLMALSSATNATSIVT